ncbi:MAG: hypothetical protein LBU04_02490, partial [Christensenellaceae bacterium]|nr:hypothetical protein [Christensenellaceae bacterium]
MLINNKQARLYGLFLDVVRLETNKLQIELMNTEAEINKSPGTKARSLQKQRFAICERILQSEKEEFIYENERLQNEFNDATNKHDTINSDIKMLQRRVNESGTIDINYNNNKLKNANKQEKLYKAYLQQYTTIKETSEEIHKEILEAKIGFINSVYKNSPPLEIKLNEQKVLQAQAKLLKLKEHRLKLNSELEEKANQLESRQAVEEINHTNYNDEIKVNLLKRLKEQYQLISEKNKIILDIDISNLKCEEDILKLKLEELESCCQILGLEQNDKEAMLQYLEEFAAKKAKNSEEIDNIQKKCDADEFVKAAQAALIANQKNIIAAEQKVTISKNKNNLILSGFKEREATIEKQEIIEEQHRQLKLNVNLAFECMEQSKETRAYERWVNANRVLKAEQKLLKHYLELAKTEKGNLLAYMKNPVAVDNLSNQEKYENLNGKTQEFEVQLQADKKKSEVIFDTKIKSLESQREIFASRLEALKKQAQRVPELFNDSEQLLYFGDYLVAPEERNVKEPKHHVLKPFSFNTNNDKIQFKNDEHHSKSNETATKSIKRKHRKTNGLQTTNPFVQDDGYPTVKDVKKVNKHSSGNSETQVDIYDRLRTNTEYADADIPEPTEFEVLQLRSKSKKQKNSNATVNENEYQQPDHDYDENNSIQQNEYEDQIAHQGTDNNNNNVENLAMNMAIFSKQVRKAPAPTYVPVSLMIDSFKSASAMFELMQNEKKTSSVYSPYIKKLIADARKSFADFSCKIDYDNEYETGKTVSKQFAKKIEILSKKANVNQSVLANYKDVPNSQDMKDIKKAQSYIRTLLDLPKNDNIGWFEDQFGFLFHKDPFGSNTAVEFSDNGGLFEILSKNGKTVFEINTTLFFNLFCELNKHTKKLELDVENIRVAASIFGELGYYKALFVIINEEVSKIDRVAQLVLNKLNMNRTFVALFLDSSLFSMSLSMLGIDDRGSLFQPLLILFVVEDADFARAIVTLSETEIADLRHAYVNQTDAEITQNHKWTAGDINHDSYRDVLAVAKAVLLKSNQSQQQSKRKSHKDSSSSSSSRHGRHNHSSDIKMDANSSSSNPEQEQPSKPYVPASTGGSGLPSTDGNLGKQSASHPTKPGTALKLKSSSTTQPIAVDKMENYVLKQSAHFENIINYQLANKKRVAVEEQKSLTEYSDIKNANMKIYIDRLIATKINAEFGVQTGWITVGLNLLDLLDDDEQRSQYEYFYIDVQPEIAVADLIRLQKEVPIEDFNNLTKKAKETTDKIADKLAQVFKANIVKLLNPKISFSDWATALRANITTLQTYITERKIEEAKTFLKTIDTDFRKLKSAKTFLQVELLAGSKEYEALEVECTQIGLLIKSSESALSVLKTSKNTKQSPTDAVKITTKTPSKSNQTVQDKDKDKVEKITKPTLPPPTVDKPHSTSKHATTKDNINVEKIRTCISSQIGYYFESIISQQIAQNSVITTDDENVEENINNINAELPGNQNDNVKAYLTFKVIEAIKTKDNYIKDYFNRSFNYQTELNLTGLNFDDSVFNQKYNSARNSLSNDVKKQINTVINDEMSKINTYIDNGLTGRFDSVRKNIDMWIPTMDARINKYNNNINISYYDTLCRNTNKIISCVHYMESLKKLLLFSNTGSIDGKKINDYYIAAHRSVSAFRLKVINSPSYTNYLPVSPQSQQTLDNLPLLIEQRIAKLVQPFYEIICKQVDSNNQYRTKIALAMSNSQDTDVILESYLKLKVNMAMKAANKKRLDNFYYSMVDVEGKSFTISFTGDDAKYSSKCTAIEAGQLLKLYGTSKQEIDQAIDEEILKIDANLLETYKQKIMMQKFKTYKLKINKVKKGIVDGKGVVRTNIESLKQELLLYFSNVGNAELCSQIELAHKSISKQLSEPSTDSELEEDPFGGMFAPRPSTTNKNRLSHGKRKVKNNVEAIPKKTSTDATGGKYDKIIEYVGYQSKFLASEIAKLLSILSSEEEFKNAKIEMNSSSYANKDDLIEQLGSSDLITLNYQILEKFLRKKTKFGIDVGSAFLSTTDTVLSKIVITGKKGSSVDKTIWSTLETIIFKNISVDDIACVEEAIETFRQQTKKSALPTGSTQKFARRTRNQLNQEEKLLQLRGIRIHLTENEETIQKNNPTPQSNKPTNKEFGSEDDAIVPRKKTTVPPPPQFNKPTNVDNDSENEIVPRKKIVGAGEVEVKDPFDDLFKQKSNTRVTTRRKVLKKTDVAEERDEVADNVDTKEEQSANMSHFKISTTASSELLKPLINKVANAHELSETLSSSGKTKIKNKTTKAKAEDKAKAKDTKTTNIVDKIKISANFSIPKHKDITFSSSDSDSDDKNFEEPEKSPFNFDGLFGGKNNKKLPSKKRLGTRVPSKNMSSTDKKYDKIAEYVAHQSKFLSVQVAKLLETLLSEEEFKNAKIEMNSSSYANNDDVIKQLGVEDLGVLNRYIFERFLNKKGNFAIDVRSLFSKATNVALSKIVITGKSDSSGGEITKQNKSKLEPVILENISDADIVHVENAINVFRERTRKPLLFVKQSGGGAGRRKQSNQVKGSLGLDLNINVDANSKYVSGKNHPLTRENGYDDVENEVVVKRTTVTPVQKLLPVVPIVFNKPIDGKGKNPMFSSSSDDDNTPIARKDRTQTPTISVVPKTPGQKDMKTKKPVVPNNPINGKVKNPMFSSSDDGIPLTRKTPIPVPINDKDKNPKHKGTPSSSSSDNDEKKKNPAVPNNPINGKGKKPIFSDSAKNPKTFAPQFPVVPIVFENPIVIKFTNPKHKGPPSSSSDDDEKPKKPLLAANKPRGAAVPKENNLKITVDESGKINGIYHASFSMGLLETTLKDAKAKIISAEPKNLNEDIKTLATKAKKNILCYNTNVDIEEDFDNGLQNLKNAFNFNGNTIIQNMPENAEDLKKYIETTTTGLKPLFTTSQKVGYMCKKLFDQKPFGYSNFEVSFNYDNSHSNSQNLYSISVNENGKVTFLVNAHLLLCLLFVFDKSGGITGFNKTGADIVFLKFNQELPEVFKILNQNKSDEAPKIDNTVIQVMLQAPAAGLLDTLLALQTFINADYLLNVFNSTAAGRGTIFADILVLWLEKQDQKTLQGFTRNLVDAAALEIRKGQSGWAGSINRYKDILIFANTISTNTVVTRRLKFLSASQKPKTKKSELKITTKDGKMNDSYPASFSMNLLEITLKDAKNSLFNVNLEDVSDEFKPIFKEVNDTKLIKNIKNKFDKKLLQLKNNFDLNSNMTIQSMPENAQDLENYFKTAIKKDKLKTQFFVASKVRNILDNLLVPEPFGYDNFVINFNYDNPNSNGQELYSISADENGKVTFLVNAHLLLCLLFVFDNSGNVINFNKTGIDIVFLKFNRELPEVFEFLNQDKLDGTPKLDDSVVQAILRTSTGFTDTLLSLHILGNTGINSLSRNIVDENFKHILLTLCLANQPKEILQELAKNLVEVAAVEIQKGETHSQCCISYHKDQDLLKFINTISQNDIVTEYLALTASTNPQKSPESTSSSISGAEVIADKIESDSFGAAQEVLLKTGFSIYGNISDIAANITTFIADQKSKLEILQDGANFVRVNGAKIPDATPEIFNQYLNFLNPGLVYDAVNFIELNDNITTNELMHYNANSGKVVVNWNVFYAIFVASSDGTSAKKLKLFGDTLRHELMHKTFAQAGKNSLLSVVHNFEIPEVEEFLVSFMEIFYLDNQNLAELTLLYAVFVPGAANLIGALQTGGFFTNGMIVPSVAGSYLPLPSSVKMSVIPAYAANQLAKSAAIVSGAGNQIVETDTEQVGGLRLINAINQNQADEDENVEQKNVSLQEAYNKAITFQKSKYSSAVITQAGKNFNTVNSFKLD